MAPSYARRYDSRPGGSSETIADPSTRVFAGMIEDCKLFNIQSDDAAQKCAFSIPQELENDDPIGPRIGLAVDVPIQSGPEEATTYLVAGQTRCVIDSKESDTAAFRPHQPCHH